MKRCGLDLRIFDEWRGPRRYKYIFSEHWVA